jgi:hypothetical protein
MAYISKTVGLIKGESGGLTTVRSSGVALFLLMFCYCLLQKHYYAKYYETTFSDRFGHRVKLFVLCYKIKA